MSLRYNVSVFDFADGGDAGFTRHNLSLAKAWRICRRQARRGLTRFGRLAASNVGTAAHALTLAGELRRGGDLAKAREALACARSVRLNPWRVEHAGAIRIHNWGCDGGRFAVAYRSAVIRLERFA